jgi:polyisoprenyl-phosphate glycosyltransferase
VDNKTYISVVIPVYLAENIIDELVKQLIQVLSEVNEKYEIVLVEDGSSDNSWAKIKDRCSNDKRIKGIKLSKNFGQHYAITAGLHESKGDFVIIMDCDLQDNPRYIKDLLKKSNEGFDVVYTIKKNRKFGFMKNFLANSFHRLYSYLIHDKTLSSSYKVGGYSLITRKVVQAFCDYGEYQRAYLPILSMLGFSRSSIFIEHQNRFEGKSSYNLKKSITLAIDGIVSHSNKLLYLSVYCGFIFTFIGAIAISYIFLKSIFSGFQAGWASVMILITFCTGLILSCMGISGIYVGKIFMQVKKRPLYLIDERLNLES